MLQPSPKKVLIVFLISVCLGFMFGCASEREKYATKQFRNIAEITKAVNDQNKPLDAGVAIKVIGDVSSKAAEKLDPDGEIKPDTNSFAIAQNPQVELQKILDSANQGPEQSGWLSVWTWVGGAALVAGAVGQFLGGPYAIAGNLLKTVASRCVPNYEKTKVAAVGVITSVETVLDQYGSLLDTMPEVKAKLQERLGGKDPVVWFKEQLKSSQTDVGASADVAFVIDLMKKEMTTDGGKLKPTVEELDQFLSKKI